MDICNEQGCDQEVFLLHSFGKCQRHRSKWIFEELGFSIKTCPICKITYTNQIAHEQHCFPKQEIF